MLFNIFFISCCPTLVHRSGVDTLNENYAQYYKHAITTDFEGDVVKWSIVQVLLVVRYV